MDYKYGLMDEEKCLITSDLSKSKTMLKNAKMISRYHQTLKLKILDKSDKDKLKFHLVDLCAILQRSHEKYCLCQAMKFLGIDKLIKSTSGKLCETNH